MDFRIILLFANQPPDGDEQSEGSVDSRGILGWEKVDKLARALVKLQGLSVTNAQASEIKELYHDLLEFDKKPLVFSPVVH